MAQTPRAISTGMSAVKSGAPVRQSQAMAPLKAIIGAFVSSRSANGRAVSYMRPLAITKRAPASIACRTARTVRGVSSLLPSSSVASKSVAMSRIIGIQTP